MAESLAHPDDLFERGRAYRGSAGVMAAVRARTIAVHTED